MIGLNPFLLRFFFLSLIATLCLINGWAFAACFARELRPYLRAFYVCCWAQISALYLAAALIDTSAKHRPTTKLKTNDRDSRCARCKDGMFGGTLKPDRAHHCSVCDRCTLKMDHHCHIVGNCIGQANHGVFLAFLCSAFGGSLAALLHVACFSHTLFASNVQGRSAICKGGYALLMGGYTLCLAGVATGCGWLLKENVEFVLRNSSTIEQLKGEANVYDLGVAANLQSFLAAARTALLPAGLRLDAEGYRFPHRGVDPELCTLDFHPFDWKAAALDPQAPHELEALAEACTALPDAEGCAGDDCLFLFGREQFR